MSEMIFIEKPPQSINDSQGRIQGGGTFSFPDRFREGRIWEFCVPIFKIVSQYHA